MKAHLRSHRVERHDAGTIFEIGSLPDVRWQVVHAQTGTGNQQAAIVTERAIRQFHPDLVMLVGIAGRLHDDLRLGDIVVATKVYAVHGGREGDTGFHPRPESRLADHRYDQQARRVADNGTWQKTLPAGPKPDPNVYFRPIASGEVVLDGAKSEFRRRLQRDYEDAAVIEMEGAGVALACHLNNVPMIDVRAVSDHAAGEKEETDQGGWQPIAARNAAAFGVAALGELTPARRSVLSAEEHALLGRTFDEQIAAVDALTMVGDVERLEWGFNVAEDPEVRCRIISSLRRLGTGPARDVLQRLKPRYLIEELMIRDALAGWQ